MEAIIEQALGHVERAHTILTLLPRAGKDELVHTRAIVRRVEHVGQEAHQIVRRENRLFARVS